MQYNEPQSYDQPAPNYAGYQPTSSAPPTYAGNQKDNTATLAAIAGVGLLVSSCTGIGGCLLPIFALVAGIIALRGSTQAINPDRTRKYAWIGIVTGGLMLLFIVGILVVYGAVIVAAINDPSSFQ